MNSVEVIQKGGSKTYARATADVFERGTLTVSWLDPESGQYGPADVFPADAWLECNVLGADGQTLFGFTNDRAFAAHLESRDLRRSRAS